MDDRRISVSQVNELGRRIRRDGGVSSATDEERLELLLADAFSVLMEVQADLRRTVPTVAFTSRVKTVPTIIDKLQRERSMALSKMRDIGGIRIVEAMDRQEQSTMAGTIRDALGGGRLVDRRNRPSWGYRAVHLEVVRRGICVEVQIRTLLQDQWAQIVERLGDSWGRQIRYGGAPAGLETKGEKTARGIMWDLIQDMAGTIDEFETGAVDIKYGSTGANPDALDEADQIMNNLEGQYLQLLQRIGAAALRPGSY